MCKLKQHIHALAAVVVAAACSAQAQTGPAAAPGMSNSTPAQASEASATNAPAPPRPNSAIIPSLFRGFANAHSNNVEVAKRGNIDVLFMGDSITDWWRSGGRGNPINGAIPYGGKAVFEKYFGTLKVANFGIAGDTTQGVLFRLLHGEGQGYSPKAIMLMIGTNNTMNNSADEIALGVADVVFELRKDFPDAKILLLGIFPRSTPGSMFRTKIADINKIIRSLHDGQHVFYMDIGWKFLAEDGTIPRDIMSDGLHPTSKGYEIWAEAVHDPLVALMK